MFSLYNVSLSDPGILKFELCLQVGKIADHFKISAVLMMSPFVGKCQGLGGILCLCVQGKTSLFNEV